MGRQGRQRRLMLIIPTCHNVRTTQYHYIPQHQYSTIALYPLYPTTNITLCHNINIPIYTTIPLYATMQPQCSRLQNTLPSLWSNFPLSPVTGLLSRTLFSTHLSKTVESGTKKSEDVDFRKTFDISFRGCNATKTSWKKSLFAKYLIISSLDIPLPKNNTKNTTILNLRKAQIRKNTQILRRWRSSQNTWYSLLQRSAHFFNLSAENADKPTENAAKN